MNRRLVCASTLLALAGIAAHALPAEPRANRLLGTWEYDPTGSSFAGRAPYRSARLTFSAVADGVQVTSDVVVANGRLFQFRYAGPEDGTFVTVSGNPYYDSASTVRGDDRTIIRTERRADKVVGVTTMQVSEDGKTLTANARRTVPEGTLYTSRITWRRVER
jgi:hypothetical protein